MFTALRFLSSSWRAWMRINARPEMKFDVSSLWPNERQFDGGANWIPVNAKIVRDTPKCN
jgi:hypothetical protein